MSSAMLDVIFKQLVEPEASENPAGKRLATDLLQSSGGVLSGVVSSFLNEILSGESDSELNESAHELILELNKIDSNLLTSVLPNMKQELQVEDFSTRHKATTVLLDMFTEPGTSLPAQYNELHNELVGRFNDTHSNIRLLMVKRGAHILRFHRQNFPTIEVVMAKKIKDPDEFVREEAVKAVLDAALQDSEAVSDDLLKMTEERMMDKKGRIRELTQECLISLYRQKAVTVDLAQQYKWIPEKLLAFHASQPTDDKSDRIRVLRAFLNELLPRDNVQLQSRRLLLLFSSLDLAHQKMFMTVMAEHAKFQALFRQFAKARQQQKQASQSPQAKGPVAKAAPALIDAAASVARFFSDAKSAQGYLLRLAQIKNPRLFKLLIEMCRPDVGFNDMQKAEEEAHKIAKTDFKTDNQKEFLQQLLSLLRTQLLGRDQMNHILSCCVQGTSSKFQFDDEEIETDKELVCDVGSVLHFCDQVAHLLPTAFSSCFPLVYTLVNKVDDSNAPYDEFPTAPFCSLLAKIVSQFRTAPLGKIRSMVHRLGTICSSSDRKCAESAAKSIAAIGSIRGNHGDALSDMVMQSIENLAQTLVSALLNEEKPCSGGQGQSISAIDVTAGRLSALSAISRTHPQVFEKYIDDVQAFIVNNLLCVSKKKTRKKHMTYPAEAKIGGLQVLTSSLLGLEHSTDNAQSCEAAEPVWKLLTAIIRKDGDLAGNIQNPANDADCAQLRLTSAQCMVQMLCSRKPDYERHFMEQSISSVLRTLNRVAHDVVAHVRIEFSKTLFKAMSTNLSKPQSHVFAALFPLMAAAVPNKDSHEYNLNREHWNWLVQARRNALCRTTSTRAKEIFTPELALPWLVFLLATSPTVDLELEDNLLVNVNNVFGAFFGVLVHGNASSHVNWMHQTLSVIFRHADFHQGIGGDRHNLQAIAEAGLCILRAGAKSILGFDGASMEINLPAKLYEPAETQNRTSRLPKGYTSKLTKGPTKRSSLNQTPSLGMKSPVGAPSKATVSKVNAAKSTAKKRSAESKPVPKKRPRGPKFSSDSSMDESDDEAVKIRVGEQARRVSLSRRAKALAPMMASNSDDVLSA